jgi:hypothetical protein
LEERRLEGKVSFTTPSYKVGGAESSIWSWESNAAKPKIHCMPAVIRFLGYSPLPEAMTLAERLMRHPDVVRGCRRRADTREPGILTKRESGEPELAVRFLVTRFL